MDDTSRTRGDEFILGVNRFVLKIRMDREIVHMEGACYETR